MAFYLDDKDDIVSGIAYDWICRMHVLWKKRADPVLKKKNWRHIILPWKN